jgi:hypothetical protein
MIYLVNGDGAVVASADDAIDSEAAAAAGLTVIASDLDLPLDRVAATSSGGSVKVIERPAEGPAGGKRLRLSTHGEGGEGGGDAADDDAREPIEIPADGSASVLVYAELLDEGGERADEAAEIRFRTSRGSLGARRVTAKGGRAKVELTSTTETVTGVVTAEAAGYAPARLAFELVPPAEVSGGKKRTGGKAGA